MDQVFSRFSLALGKSNAHTLSEFINVIRGAYTPTPDVKELTATFDMHAWLQPHLHDMSGVTQPHQFLFSRDPAAACGTSVVSQEFSNTPPRPKQVVLKSLPTTPPMLRGGRKLFHRSQKAGGSDGQSERDFLDMEKQLQDFFETYDFPSSSRDEWRLTIESIRKKEAHQLRELPDGYFWPLSFEDLRDMCDEEHEEVDTEEVQAADLRQRALAHARMREENRFQGMMCGPGIRYKSTEPQHATRGNIVVIRNKTTLPESLLLGKYESLFSIGKVRLISLASVDLQRLVVPPSPTPLPRPHSVCSNMGTHTPASVFLKVVSSVANNKRKRDRPPEESCDEPRTRKVIYYEPYVCGEDGERPLWLHNLEVGDGKGIDSNWPSVVSMQWREIKQLPLATFEALHQEAQPGFRCPEQQIDRNFLKSGFAVAKLKKGWEQTLEIDAFTYVCEMTSSEMGEGKRGGNAPIDFDTETQMELKAMAFSTEDGHWEYVGDFDFSPAELNAR